LNVTNYLATLVGPVLNLVFFDVGQKSSGIRAFHFIRDCRVALVVKLLLLLQINKWVGLPLLSLNQGFK